MKVLGIRVCALVLACGSLLPSAEAQQAQYSHGDPTALEQQMLELINRARQNPTQEGVILDSVNTWYSRDARTRKPSFFANLRSEFASYPAVPPLAFHPKLIQSARAHSQDMITRNFFAHVNPSGLDPTARAAAIGYDSGVGENIDGAGAASGDEVWQAHFGFMVDYDNIDTSHPLGHRLNVLESTYSEAGVGIVGPYSAGRITQDFGAPARAYILGVAYNDTNGNGAYDPGEGLAGITVRPDVGNWYAVTSSSGGFTIPIDAIQTVTDNVSLPFPVQGNTWPAAQSYDQAYRQQQMQAAPALTVNLTWSSGGLTASKTTSTTIKRPVQRNYRLTGTDGWYYSMSMVTTQNVKADWNATLAQMVTPANGTTLNSGTVPFTWSAAGGATAYWLYVGSAPGASDYHDSGNLGSALTRTVSGLPVNGTTIHVRLFSRIGVSWGFNDYAYTAFTDPDPGKAQMATPLNGAALSSMTVPFTWNAGSRATAYWLYVGGSPGASDLYDSGRLANSVLTQTLSGLPADGRTVHVRLWSLVGGVWLYNDCLYKALSQMVTPANWTTLTSGAVPFTWSSASGATAYWLYVGSAPGASDYHDSGNLGSALTRTISGLPTNGNTIYARLFSRVAGAWIFNDFAYQASSGGSSPKARMATPASGTTLGSGTVPFTWNAGNGATAYWLYVGSSLGASNYEDSGNLGSALTRNVSGLPVNGSTVYVRLFSRVGGAWFFNDYAYAASGQ